MKCANNNVCQLPSKASWLKGIPRSVLSFKPAQIWRCNTISKFSTAMGAYTRSSRELWGLAAFDSWLLILQCFAPVVIWVQYLRVIINRYFLFYYFANYKPEFNVIKLFLKTIFEHCLSFSGYIKDSVLIAMLKSRCHGVLWVSSMVLTLRSSRQGHKSNIYDLRF